MAKNLTTEASLTPTPVDSNVAAGNDLPKLDMSFDALATASHMHEQGDMVPDVFLDEAVVQTPPAHEVALDAMEGEVDEPVQEASDEAQEGDVEVESQADIETQTDVDNLEKLGLSYTDLLDQVETIEIGGKDYSPSDLKSILGQDVSAGQKAREASERLNEIAAKEAQLTQKETMLKARENTHVNSGQLAQLQSQWTALNTELTKARTDGDVYQLQITKDKMEQIGQAYNQTDARIKQDTAQQQQLVEAQALEGLKQRGLDFIFHQGPQAKDWANYASSKLTETEFSQATLSPAFAEMVDKARKWDTAQGKEGKKLVSKAKTLKASGRKAPSKAQQTDALNRKIASGQGTPQERADAINSAYNQQGRDMFRPLDG